MEIKKEIWRKMQLSNYHPDIDGVIDRIKNDIANNNSLFKTWGEYLDEDINIKDKVVLEIGHGGGWWLSQMLRNGAKLVIGVEICEEINNKSERVFGYFGYKDYKFYETDERCLDVVKEKVDVIFEITVFQHTGIEIAKKYLETSKNILNEDGVLYLQFFMDDVDKIKQVHYDTFNISYTHIELLKLFDDCGYIVDRFGDQVYDTNGNDYWRIYKLKVK